ncbi:hypothetical protein T492DRAFT_840183 [Pavlovales sp. CCMP2436]|nr:hypothetical protein T492DRAFT_840183 [Pavlovales sp. CCMP2436]
MTNCYILLLLFFSFQLGLRLAVAVPTAAELHLVRLNRSTITSAALTFDASTALVAADPTVDSGHDGLLSSGLAATGLDRTMWLALSSGASRTGEPMGESAVASRAREATPKTGLLAELQRRVHAEREQNVAFQRSVAQIWRASRVADPRPGSHKRAEDAPATTQGVVFKENVSPALSVLPLLPLRPDGRATEPGFNDAYSGASAREAGREAARAAALGRRCEAAKADEIFARAALGRAAAERDAAARAQVRYCSGHTQRSIPILLTPSRGSGLGPNPGSNPGPDPSPNPGSAKAATAETLGDVERCERLVDADGGRWKELHAHAAARADAAQAQASAECAAASVRCAALDCDLADARERLGAAEGCTYYFSIKTDDDTVRRRGNLYQNALTWQSVAAPRETLWHV